MKNIFEFEIDKQDIQKMLKGETITLFNAPEMKIQLKMIVKVKKNEKTN